jgi:hypothetical protein
MHFAMVRPIPRGSERNLVRMHWDQIKPSALMLNQDMETDDASMASHDTEEEVRDASIPGPSRGMRCASGCFRRRAAGRRSRGYGRRRRGRFELDAWRDIEWRRIELHDCFAPAVAPGDSADGHAIRARGADRRGAEPRPSHRLRTRRDGPDSGLSAEPALPLNLAGR